ncbi:MAG: hypothetical protein JWL81_230, partial [Verrucomicrobiales bacterium]|nr:hypothetical protein [Verrucomicrobiales bacterium]
LVAVETTDLDGYYHFSGVMPGRYYLQFPVSASGGLALSPNGQSVDATSDSDPDPETGMTAVFEAYAGLDDDTRDAGYHQPPATIRGTAWHDVNKNGIREAGDDAIAGVTVLLQDVATDLDVAGAVTDAQGNYEFSGLASQAWRVEFTRYAGDVGQYQLTAQDAGGDDLVDSDVSVSDLRTHSVTPVNGQVMVLDAGYKDVRLGLGNGVFKDYNGSGTFNAGEGVMDVRVELYNNNEPLELVKFTTTSVGGTYYFNDLAPGDYFVKIPAEQFQDGGPLTGWVSLPGEGVDDQLDDNLGENGEDAAYPAGSGIRSNVVHLASGTEPRSSPGTETGRENTADNTDDFHIDLTVDFGFTPGMTLGNLVFEDLDGNGVFTPGEGVGRVALELYGEGMAPGEDRPLGTVTTDADGLYQFTGLKEGAYVVHVAADNFSPLSRLGATASLTEYGAASGADDGVDENGIDSTDEARYGVSSAPVVLIAHEAPTAADGETGQGSAADDLADDMGDLTVDFGFRKSPPGSYSTWLSRGGAGGGAGLPGGDADQDGWPNALEYFFNLPTDSPTAMQQPMTMSADPESGRIKLSVVFNPRAGEASPSLEFRPFLNGENGEWTSVIFNGSTRTTLPDGMVRVTWEDLEALPGMAGGSGFVRLSVGFDTDGDGNPDGNYPAGMLGWRERTHRAGLASTGFSLLKPSLFRGTVSENTAVPGGVALTFGAAAGGDMAGLLGAGLPCYAEVASGPWTGHRFEVRESAASGNVLELQSAAPLNTLAAVPDLTGALVVLREHWTLNEVFPPAEFVASTSPSTSDRVMRFTRPSFTNFWLLNLDGTRRWVKSDDLFLTDAGKLPIPPGEGLFMERTGVAQGVLDIGEVRTHRMARNLTAGNSLVTSGWPVEGSPRSWGLLGTDGFFGSNNPALADAFQIWQADTEGGQRAMRGYFLLDAGAPWQYWAAKSDAELLNQDDAPLFAPGQAIFLQTHAPVTAGYEPCPLPAE